MSSSPLLPPCEICGWLAAGASALGFGSFGVPIKGAPIVDPLVFQSYKTTMCFLTCWLVLAWGEEFVFSPWGIVSGLFWVPGGVATVYAIQTAGLAIGIGIGSSFIVLVSYTWGIFVFHEKVHSRFWSSVAVLCMMLGLLGMSYFSSPESIDVNASMQVQEDQLELDGTRDDLQLHRTDEQQDRRISARIRQRNDSIQYQGLPIHKEDDHETEANTPRECWQANLTPVTESHHHRQDSEPDEITHELQEPETIMLFGRKRSRRRIGMLCAVFTGCWGGSIMAPMKYAPADAKGTHFLISFAIGSSLINVILWLLRYLYYFQQSKSTVAAFERLPSFHLTDMWKAGMACGLLWSFGNFFSLLSVYYLGEGVGYPLVQTSILISGIWGIFYFREIEGQGRVAKWFASSLLTICGILLLSYEHHEK